MQAILYCDKTAECIPMQDCPEALLPFCNVPLLTHLLTYLEKSGFQNAVLIAAEERIRRTLDGLHLQMPVRFVDSLASLRAEAPTLLLRRLCLPEWDMGELYALCKGSGVKLSAPDGSPAEAELHPTGSALLEPKETAALRLSHFRHADTPAAYRKLQQEMLLSGKSARRIGEGVHIGQGASVDRTSILGNDCIIGDKAVLEGCVLGDGVQVGEGAVLKDCVVCRHALVDREAHLTGGVVPEGSVLPPHARYTQTRNLLVLPEDGICGGLSRWNTAETALQAGAAMVSLGSRLAVGYSHPAGEGLALAAAAGAVSQGARVWQTGACALSQLLYAARLTGCDAVLWASGEESIQLLPFGAQGQALTQAQTMRLWRALDSGISDRIVRCGRFSDASGMLHLWEDENARQLPDSGLPEITVSCANPALREAAQRLFSGGAGEKITLTLSEDGRSARAFSLEAGLLREEQLLLLAMLSFRDEPMALPEDFHPAAEDFAARNGCRVLRMHSPAFSPTAAQLYEKQAVCCDGVRLFVRVLRVLTERKLTLRQAASLLPKLCTVQRELSTSLTRQEVENLQNRNPEPSVKMTLPPQGRLVKLRVHADSMETAAELCGMWEKKLRHAEQG